MMTLRDELVTELRAEPGTGNFITWAQAGELLLDAQTELMDTIVVPLRRRVEVLEKQLAALEAKPTVKYMGVYKPGAAYTEGSFVTRDGSIFHANKTTREAPGDGCADWTLAVKRGRDAKDAAP